MKSGDNEMTKCDKREGREKRRRGRGERCCYNYEAATKKI